MATTVKRGPKVATTVKRGPKVATTVKRRLLRLAIIERQIITLTTTAKPQQLRVNSREMTTFAASCNDCEMQRPRSDKFETAQLLQILRKILCRFMAVVVSSAFWKSLMHLNSLNRDMFKPFPSHNGLLG